MARTKKNVVIGWSEAEGTEQFEKALKDIFLAVPGLTDRKHIRYFTSKADIDEAVYDGSCDVLFLSETINGTPVGKGEIRKYLANGTDGINVILVVSDDKKGAGKLKGLYGYGYYNAIFKKDCTPAHIEELVKNPRTAPEAYDYYGLESYQDPLDESGDRAVPKKAEKTESPSRQKEVPVKQIKAQEPVNKAPARKKAGKKAGDSVPSASPAASVSSSVASKKTKTASARKNEQERPETASKEERTSSIEKPSRKKTEEAVQEPSSSSSKAKKAPAASKKTAETGKTEKTAKTATASKTPKTAKKKNEPVSGKEEASVKKTAKGRKSRKAEPEGEDEKLFIPKEEESLSGDRKNAIMAALLSGHGDASFDEEGEDEDVNKPDGSSADDAEGVEDDTADSEPVWADSGDSADKDKEEDAFAEETAETADYGYDEPLPDEFSDNEYSGKDEYSDEQGYSGENDTDSEQYDSEQESTEEPQNGSASENKALSFPKEKAPDGGEIFEWSDATIQDYLTSVDVEMQQPKSHPITLSPVDKVTEAVLKHYTKEDPSIISNLEKHLIQRDDFEKNLRDYMTRTFRQPSEILSAAYSDFLRYMFSYDVITPLVEDPMISDIKVYTPDNVRIKRKGKRGEAKEKFRSDAHYRAFVSHLARQNNVSINTGDDIVHFTDTNSFEGYRLRVNISTEFINSTNFPCVQIRKINNQKYTTQQLIDAHMFSARTAAYLINAAKNDSGIVFTGKGSAGKTTCMNWLVDYIPRDCSGICIQESDELFSNVHPDILFQRIADDKESQNTYDLKTLSVNALLTDVDYFIIGEIKGAEARYFLNAAYTGNRCWCSVHSPSSQGALPKIADYATYESPYSRDELLQMLTSLKVVVFLKNFHVAEISEVEGWDYDRHCIKYKRIPLD